jgi:hypothetical protein
MRLTVGPLPAAVYWRRRGVVLAAVVLVVLILSYAFTGTAKPSEGAGPGGGASSSATASPTPTLLRPQVGESPKPSQTAFTLPTTGASGPCTDAEMQVAATAASPQSRYNTPVALTIRFRNISSRSCQRDIGADVQELRILSGETLIWSSDDCSPNHGTNVSSFGPGQEAKFNLTWAGKVSRGGTGTVTCSATAAPAPPGVYQVVGRLADKLSEPFTLRLT